MTEKKIKTLDVESNDAQVRGTLTVVKLETEMEVEGKAAWEGGELNKNGIKLFPGVTINPDSGNSIYWETFEDTEAYVSAVRNSAATDLRLNIYSATRVNIGVNGNNEALAIRSDSGPGIRANLPFIANNGLSAEGAVSLNADSSNNIVISTESGTGELQLKVNSTEGMNITGLPTSNPFGTNNIWKDSNGFLRIT